MSDAIPADTKYTAGDQIEFYDVGKFETSKGEVRRPAKGSPFGRQALQLTCSRRRRLSSGQVIGAKWLKAPCIVTQRDAGAV
jgi:hypothetical protein